MRQKIKSSFRLRFSLSVMLVILIPVLIIFAFISYRGYQSIETNAQNVLANQSNSLSQSAFTFEETAQLALDNMRRQPVIRSMDPELQKPSLENMTDVYTSMYLALTADLSGTSLARSDDADEVEYGDRAWFREASTGYEGYQQSLISRTTGKPAIVYASPIEQEDGEIVGVAFIGTELTTLAEVVGAIKIGDTGLGYLVDSEGFMIAHPDSYYSSGDLVFVGNYPPVFDAEKNGITGSYSFIDEDGVEWLADIQPVGNGWYAIVQQHRSEAMAALPVYIATAVGLTLLTILVIGLLTYIVAGQAVKPIEYLTSAATAVSTGHLNESVIIDRVDEIGMLATAFNSMTIQLRDFISNLETRVSARTEDLNLAAMIGQQVAQARNIDDVLNEATTSIKDQFFLYQVQIYLTDSNRENLLLRASDGFAGSRLLETGHQLPIDDYSLNGSAAYTKQAVIVADTHENSQFRPHPLLPDTRSEMVVPLMIEDDVLGVIDLQSTEANSLTEDVLPAFTVLAGQLAIAIMNARQNRTMQENQRLMRTIIDSSPDWIFVKNHEHRYQVVNQAYANSFHISPEEFIGKNDLDLGFPEEIVKGNPDKGIRGFWADDQEIMDSGKMKQIPEEPGEVDGKPVVLQTVKAPLMDADGNATGVVGFVHDITSRKQAEETIVKRADELQAVSELSTAVATIADPQQLLQAVVDLTKQRFDLYHAHIYLVDDSGQNLVLTAGAGEAGKKMVAEGRSIPLSQEQSLVSRAARGKKGVIVNDVMTDTGFLPNPLLPRTRSEMAIPIIIGSDVLGVLDVQADSVNRFSDEDIQIKTTLASQTAVALQNAYQIQRTRTALQEASSFRRLVEGTRQGIGIGDAQGTVYFANQALAHMVGQKASEMVGNPMFGLYPPDIQLRFQEEIIPAVLEQGQWEGELRILGANGEELPTFENYFILPDEEGNPAQIAALISDISERKQTEEAIRANQALMRTIIDSSPDWIFVKNKEHRYQVVNKAYADSFHQTPEEFIGKNDLELGFPEDIIKGNPEKGIRGFWPDDDEIMANKEMKVIPEEPGEVDGQAVVLRTIKAPLIDAEGNATGIVGFVQDITAQKETQIEQERLTQEFEEQLTQINALQRVMTRDNWSNYIDAQHKDETGFAFTGKSVEPFDSNSLKALTGGLSIDPDMLSQMAYDESQTAVILPLQLHNESIGIVGARNANGDPINAEQKALLTTLTAQVAESLDRARLFEETETARSQTESLFTGSQQVVRSTNVTEILHAVINATRLQSYERANMIFFDRLLAPGDAPEFATITAVWSQDGQPNSMPVGTKLAIEQYPLFSFLDRERPMFIDDIAADDRVDDNVKTLLLNQLNMRGLLTVPLVVGNNWLGSIVCVTNEPQKINDDDIRQIVSLSGQAATVAQSQRLYQEASTRAEREQILRQVSDRVYAAPDAETVLRTAAREIGQALGLETYIYLEDPENN